MCLYDVSNPAAPIPSGVIQVPCAGPGITFSGDMAYIVDYRENVVVVNIADLNSPWLVGSHVGAKLPFGLAIIGDRLYACDDRAAGIQVLPTQCAVTGVGEPAAATSRWFLSSPYPNPSSGPVSLAYTALKAVPMTLSVLNVSGCLVRRLDEPASSTGGRLVWDGRDDTGRPVLPGIYYLRLVQAGEAVVRKIVRVR